MTDIFLFGTLCHMPVLRIVAGGDPVGRPAIFPGARVERAADTGWPVLVARPGEAAKGLLISVGAQECARLDAYEACFGYHRAAITVMVEGMPHTATVYRASKGESGTDGPWSLTDWARDWGKLEELAAEEVMRQLQSAPPEEVGARFWMIAARAQSVVSAMGWQRPALVGVNPARDAVDLVEQRLPYTKFLTVEELSLSHRRFDGSIAPRQERAVFRVADAVTVLPYDPVRDRILVIEQLRLGPYAHGDGRPWLLEPVAGMIDAGEPPETAARRETEEEAGLSLGALHQVARYYPSPGGLAQVLTSYVGIADLPDDITGIGGHDGEGEDILSHLVPWDLACEMLAAGDMVNAPLVISMQWLQLNRAALRASG
jgi:nudix-type nucleoside diphosphatase (YffH/AdpP family)